MKSKSGSTLVVVIIASIAVGIVSASIVSLISTQRKLSVAKELQLQANNVAESAIDYVYSYAIYDLMANGKDSTTWVPATGKKDVTSNLSTAVKSFLTGSVAAPSGWTGNTSTVTFSDLKVVVLARPSTTPVRYWVDGNDPANADHPGKNLWVEEYSIPIVASVKATLGKSTYTAYLRKDIADMSVPGFQHAIFYEMQLQVHRGYPILGAVHTNADLILNAHTSDTAKYNGSVTCHGKFYRGSTIDVGGTGADPYGFTPIKGGNQGLDFSYTDPNTGEIVKLVAENSTNLTILATTKPSVTYKQLGLTFDSRMATWKNSATSTFGGFLADISHDVPALTLPGGKGYQQDVAATNATNEFSNLPYALIEPVLPTGNAAKKSKDIQFNNLNANASLILRIESTKVVVAASPGAGEIAKSTIAVDPTAYFVVKAYKYADTTIEPWERDPTTETNLKPVWLPKGVIGICNNNATVANLAVDGTKNLAFEKYVVDGATDDVTGALHDARMGRGVHLLTLDIAKLKHVMEKNYNDCTDDEKAFRLTFDVTGADWKRGVVYIQFPTSLLTVPSTSPSTSPVGVVDPSTGTTVKGATPSLATAGGTDNMTTYRFQYGTAELRHPNRWENTDNHGRANRTDKIVPMAPELRGYPATYTEAELQKPDWCFPAVQIINAKALPNPTGSPGFSIATNAPVYLVGSYNSDGDITTNTNLTATAPDAYAKGDTWSYTYASKTTTVSAVPSMIMCDMLTFLSNDWFARNIGSGRYGNRRNSFFGYGNDAIDFRDVTSGPVEIDACIATGGYPVFEFFAHTLEDWQDYYGKTSYPNPIIIKGSMVAEWESEIQHIKQAYGRDKLKDIQVYWADHGAYGIPAVRFHKRLMDGTEIPGAPRTPIYDQRSFRMLRPGVAADKTIISSAGL